MLVDYDIMRTRHLLLLGLALIAAHAQEAKPVRWDGTVVLKGLKVPFSMMLTFHPKTVEAEIVNGEQRVRASSGTLNQSALKLTFSQPESELVANVTAGELTGAIGPQKYKVEAAPYCTCSADGEAGPDISGRWTVGERADWSLDIRRIGEDTVAKLQRGSNIIPALNGRFDGLQFLLHYFDGVRGALLDITPNRDGSLELTVKEPGEAAITVQATKATH